MNRIPVKSSNIKSIGFDPESKRLEVEFKSGGVFSYDDISPKEHEALVNAESIGSHFHKTIRQNKTGKRVDTDAKR